MTLGRQIPTQTEDLASIVDRLSAIERRWKERPPERLRWARLSCPTEGEETGPFACVEGGAITRIVARNGPNTPGSTATTAQVLLDGAVISTFSFTGATDFGFIYDLGNQGSLTGLVTAYGTDAAACVILCIIEDV